MRHKLRITAPQQQSLIVQTGQEAALDGDALWTSPRSTEALVDIRQIEIIDDPDNVDQEHEEKYTRVYIGDAAVQALKKFASWQDSLHADAMTKLLSSQAMDITIKSNEPDFQPDTYPLQQFADFTTAYTARAMSIPYYARPIHNTGVPVALHPDVAPQFASNEAIQDAVIKGFLESDFSRGIITPDHAVTINDRLSQGKRPQIGKLIFEATRQAAEAGAERLAEIDGGDLLRLDADKVVSLVKSSRPVLQQLVRSALGQPSWYKLSSADPAFAALQKYAKL